MLAKHRRSDTIEPRDLMMHLGPTAQRRERERGGRERSRSWSSIASSSDPCACLPPSSSPLARPPRSFARSPEKQWQIRIPGFALPESALSHVPTVGHGGVPSTLASVTNTHVRNIVSPAYGIGEAHRKRLALIAKAKQKEAKKSMARVQATAAATAAAATGGPATGVVPMDETSNSTATGSTVKANLAAPAKKRKRPTEE